MKLYIFLPSCGLLFLLLSTNASADRNCEKEYELVASARIKPAVAKLSESKKAPRNIVTYLRDYVRNRLMVAHEHTYPIIAMDDATPVKAYSLAADNFGLLSKEQSALVSIPEIKTEIGDLLTAVEAFPANKKGFLDETATLVARVEVLEKEISADSTWKNFFKDVSVPKATVNDDGTVSIVMVTERFSNRTQMEIELNTAKRILGERLGKKFFGMNGMQMFAMDHAVMVKKLETYRSEINRQMLLDANKGKPLNAELKTIYDRISALFVDADGITLKGAYDPPSWAWQKMRWMQLSSELRAVIQKDIPRMKDTVANNNVVEFLKGLSPEELRAVGVSNVADSLSFLGRTKMWQFITASTVGASATGGPVAYGAKTAWDIFVKDASAKELCAAEISDEKFRECVVEFLQMKFPTKVIAQLLTSKEAFLNPDGTIKDSEVAKQVKDILKRKKKFASERYFRENSKEALMQAIQNIMNETDQSSEGRRKKIVSTPLDDSFYLSLVGNSDPQIPSFLAFRFPTDFPRNEEWIRNALKAPLDSDEQFGWIQKIRNGGSIMLADELEDLVLDRKKFLRGQVEDPAAKPADAKPGNTGTDLTRKRN